MTKDELEQQAIRLANELRKVRNVAKRASPSLYARLHAKAMAIRKQMSEVLDQHARTP